MTATPDALPGLAARAARRDGALYRATCAQVAALVADGIIDPDRQAGMIAAVRLLAHQVDLAGGHGPVGKREPYAVASLMREYRATLEALSGITADDTPAWLADDDPALTVTGPPQLP